MYLIVLAARREIPAVISITADTGWENDRLWSNGRRTSASAYFDEVVVPLCNTAGIQARFVRSRDKSKKHLMSLREHVESAAKTGNPHAQISIPLFGSRGGRLMQTCTDKWKIRALRQEARRMGATTNCNAQGIHYGEADRRIRGRFLEKRGKWNIYQTTVSNGGDMPTDVKWITHYYPLVDLRLRREHTQAAIEKEGIPYLISSECDGCPHQDLPRWERHTPENLTELSEVEKLFNGEYFFTEKRIPLLEALEEMKRDRRENPDLFNNEPSFGCNNAICGV